MIDGAAVNGLHIDFFTIDGHEDGVLQLPCDGVTTVPIVLQISGVITAKEAGTVVNLPIWIGEHHIFRPDKTLIRGVLFPSGAAGARVTVVGNYALTCSTACALTPSGRQPSVLPGWLTWFINRFLLLSRVGGPFWVWVYKKLFAPVLYVIDDKDMLVTAAYYDASQWFFAKWWYRQKAIRVQCVGSLSAKGYAAGRGS